MKTRPHQERRDFAAACSFVIVGILFFGWIVLFARNVQSDVASRSDAAVSDATGTSASDALSQLTQQIQNTRAQYSASAETATPSTNAPQVINIDAIPAPADSATNQ